jgi:hypothetical protein
VRFFSRAFALFLLGFVSGGGLGFYGRQFCATLVAFSD